MRNNQIVGLVLLVVGGILFYFGYQSSESLGEQVHESFTGRFTDTTVWYLVIGAASAVTGLVLLLKRKV